FYTQESSLVPEIKSKVEAIFAPKIAPDEYKNEFETIKKVVKNLKPCQDYDEFKEELMSASGLKGKNFFMPLRQLLTGELHGPELSELYPLIKDDLTSITA
ncbi:MAG: glutamate--tRNA ligase, partial [Campylobacter sp.]|nr:glutamate--tRNA ligase [Campylobacter sp.]